MGQSQLIIQTLKGLLKQHKINYAQVASHLDLSESSVKRAFSQNQLSLDRLVQICELMGMEVVDLLQVIKNQNEQLMHLSEAQEELIVSDLRLLLVTVCVCNHWLFEEMHGTYVFEESELISLLLKLENIDLIELKPNNQIKLKISKQFHWMKDGPIEQFFAENIQQDFFRSHFNKPGELRLLANGMLTKQSNQLVQQHMQKLIQAFNQQSMQDQHKTMREKHGTSLLLAIRPWELGLFAKLRRNSEPKPFV